MDVQLLMENYEVPSINAMQTETTPIHLVWNMNSVLEYARKKTQHRQKTREDETDVTKLVAMMVGLLILFIIYAIIKCFIQKRICSRCVFTRVDGRFFPRIHFLSSAPGFDQVMDKLSPPPAYEHPPSYHVAVEMESRKKNEDIKVLCLT